MRIKRQHAGMFFAGLVLMGLWLGQAPQALAEGPRYSAGDKDPPPPPPTPAPNPTPPPPPPDPDE